MGFLNIKQASGLGHESINTFYKIINQTLIIFDKTGETQFNTACENGHDCRCTIEDVNFY